MDTLTESAFAHAPPDFLLLLILAVARTLAVWAALMFAGITLAASFMTRRILGALGRQYATPFNYAILFYYSTKTANPFAIASGVSSALIALLSYDNYERVYWTVVLMLIAVFPACFSKRGAARSILRLQEEDAEKTPSIAADKALLIDGGKAVWFGEETNRQFRQWMRMDACRCFFAAFIGLLTLVSVMSAGLIVPSSPLPRF